MQGIPPEVGAAARDLSVGRVFVPVGGRQPDRSGFGPTEFAQMQHNGVGLKADPQWGPWVALQPDSSSLGPTGFAQMQHNGVGLKADPQWGPWVGLQPDGVRVVLGDWHRSEARATAIS